MDFSKIKAAFALLTGGISGILKYFLNVFNDQVLGKITDKESGVKYIKDAQAIYALIRSFLENHASDLSDKKKAAGEAILAAIEELTKALEDFTVQTEELDLIIEKVKAAIDAWKAAK